MSKRDEMNNQNKHYCKLHTSDVEVSAQLLPGLTSWKGGYKKNGQRNESGCTSETSAYERARDNLLNQIGGKLKIRNLVDGSWISLTVWSEDNPEKYEELKERIEASIQWADRSGSRVGNISAFALKNALSVAFA